jgi:hypothetical protein
MADFSQWDRSTLENVATDMLDVVKRHSAANKAIDESEAWLLLTLNSDGTLGTHGNVSTDKWATALRELAVKLESA